MSDIFDEIIAERKPDLFDEILQERTESEKTDIFSKIEEEVTPLIRTYVKNNIPKSLSKDEIKDIVEDAISKTTIPEKVIEKIIEKETIKPIIKEVERQDTSEIDALKEEIKKLKKNLNDVRGSFSVVGTALPNYSDKESKFLRANKGSLSWADAGGADASSGTFVFGDGVSDGSWRLTISGTDFIVQYLLGGVWTESSRFIR